MQLKEGKDEVITAGHFNLVWPTEKETLTSKQQALEGDSEGESSVIKSALLDNDQHPATHLNISKNQNFSEVSHSIKIHSTQRAISLTGFSDGVYYAKLFDANKQAVSNTVRVIIEHHSMLKVWLIFLSGATLFLILIGYMLVTVFRHKEEA
ncbi:hypothetical protein GCM10009123_09360 [Kangiella japonica]|uniref:Uncharacterized protein n=1 Tax=Kangiella japonica TaxID=647384 RepID=A0ABN0SWX2_9GAMM